MENAVFDFDETGEYAADSVHELNGRPNEVVAGTVTAFLANRPRGKPFFAYAGFTASTDPRSFPEECRSMYSQSASPLPPNFSSEQLLGTSETDESVTPTKLASQARSDARELLAGYYGMISHLDAQIGVIMAALKANGLEDNTIIVFTSSNGRAVGSHGLAGGQNLYEHSIRVPLVLSGPGIPGGKQYISMCYQMDVYPTVGALVGAAVPGTIEGKSLLPILTARGTGIRNTIYAAYTDKQRSIRDYRWKLIFYPQTDRYQLFNLRNDPDEADDLFSSGGHGRDINRLRIQLSAWQSSLDDPLR